MHVMPVGQPGRGGAGVNQSCIRCAALRVPDLRLRMGERHRSGAERRVVSRWLWLAGSLARSLSDWLAVCCRVRVYFFFLLDG